MDFPYCWTSTGTIESDREATGTIVLEKEAKLRLAAAKFAVVEGVGLRCGHPGSTDSSILVLL